MAGCVGVGVGISDFGSFVFDLATFLFLISWVCSLLGLPRGARLLPT